MLNQWVSFENGPLITLTIILISSSFRVQVFLISGNTYFLPLSFNASHKCFGQKSFVSLNIHRKSYFFFDLNTNIVR